MPSNTRGGASRLSNAGAALAVDASTRTENTQNTTICFTRIDDQ
jgi:hypothetical protein